MNTTRKHTAALALVLLLAGMLRWWHVDFGLPDRFHPDETTAAFNVVDISNGATTLEHYRHPPLLKLAAAALLATRVRIEGKNKRPGAAATLALRSVSVLAGIATVLLTYLVALRFASANTAVIAALLCAVMPLMIVQSKYGTPDMLLAAAYIGAFWTQLRLVERPTLARATCAGMAVSLAVAAKYNGVFIAASLFTALVIIVRNAGTAKVRSEHGANLRGLLAALVAGGIVGFFIGFPFVAFGDLQALLTSTLSERDHLFKVGHTGIQITGPEYYFVYHFVMSILPAAGPILLAVLPASLGAAAIRPRSIDVMLLAAIVPFYLAIEAAYKIPPSPERYVVPLVPLYLVALAALLTRALARVPEYRRTALTIASASVLAAWPLVRTLQIVPYLAPDTREIMDSWIIENIDAGATVVAHRADVRHYYPPHLATHLELIDYNRVRAGGVPEPRYAIASSLIFDRYVDRPGDVPDVTEFYRRIRRPGALVHYVDAGRASYMFNNPRLELYELERDVPESGPTAALASPGKPQ